MEKHTKGKWKPTFNSAKERGVRSVGGFICFLTKPKHYEGQDQRYEDELIEAKANAILIASAPELLEMLIELRNFLSSELSEHADGRKLLGKVNKKIKQATNPNN